MSCPVYYNIRYKSNLNVDQVQTRTRLLNQIVNSFCLKLMEGKVMPTYDIKRKWDMLTKKYPDVITPKVNLEGITLLLNFYRWAANNEIIVVDIGTPYSIQFQEGDITTIFNGNFGILTINQAKQLEELVVNFSSKMPDQTRLDAKLETSLTHVAFQKLYKTPLLGTKIYHAKSNKEFYTIRDARTEEKKLSKIVCNVARSINENIWYPHESPMCAGCKVNDFCIMYGKGSI